MKKLFTSYNFWTAFAGAVGLFVMTLGKCFGLNINADGVEEIIMTFCGVLVVFGLVVKPKPVDNEDANLDVTNNDLLDEIELHNDDGDDNN